MIATVRIAESKAKAAAALGMSVTTLEKWLQRGAPKLDNGGYDLDDVAAFIEAWKLRADGAGRGGGPSGGSGDDDDLRDQKLKAEIRKINADAEARELKNQIASGSVYIADEADQFMNEEAARSRERIEQFPSEAVMGVPPEFRDMIRQNLEVACRELLIELSGREFRPRGEDAGFDS